MEVNPDYKIFDADSHYYEPDDCFTRHMEKACADRAVRVVHGEGKYARVYIGSERSKFYTASPGEITGAAGSMMEFSDPAETAVIT
ncbi:MAG: hypothetical protein JO121_03935 [Deltaproteobacteria bacterium]|jgi:D-tyrosyl-tRNA(Tyr) deacylase|nr:hypothetical protein [Deltaproteobacteria bacterium]